ncbi:hypothetical protein [Streptomyces sp. NPDC006384]
MSAITTAPAQVGNGRAVHYVRKDEFHSNTIGCGRTMSREMTEREANGRKECGPCKRAVEALAAEQPAEQAPATDFAPAVEGAYEHGQRLEAQALATNEVIAERARAVLTEAGATEAADGRAGFRIQVNHLAVRLYARDEQGCHDQDRLDQFGAFLELRDWFAEPGTAAFHGPCLALLPPAGQAREVVLEGKQRREAAEQRRQELVTEVAARTLVLGTHSTAHSFQPVDQPDGERGERIAWTFRTGHGARARYHWVSVRNVISMGVGSEYRWQAERSARLGRRTGLDEAPMPDHIAQLLTEPTETLERMAAALDQDTVQLKPDGVGRWAVVRGGTYLGDVRDQGARYTRRGRYAANSPYGKPRKANVGYFHDLDAARDAVAEAWPVQVTEIAGDLGVPVAQVLEVAGQVEREWQPEGRPVALRSLEYTGAAGLLTQAAAAEVRQRLAVPFHGPADYAGPRGLCGYDDHTAPLLPSGKLAQHDRQQGVMLACPGSCRPGRGSREELTMRDTTAVIYNPPRPRGLACRAKEGDLIVVDGQVMEVKSLQVDEATNAHVWLVLDGVSLGPLRFTLEDRLEYRRRVRRDDVPCRVCGVYVVMEVDEAVDGVPNTRLCGLCDRQQPDELTEDQARASVERTYPHAQKFQAERTEYGRLLGYTFQVGRLHSARYGWIAPAGTYAQGLEDYRSQAAAMLPLAARDEQTAHA